MATPPAFGLKVLSTGNNETFAVDIVAIHGLDGHREDSFTHSNDHCWLKSLSGAFPDARILTYGYDAAVGGKPQLSQDGLFAHGQNLLVRLSLNRQSYEAERRPIIFLAHNSGGLVLKHALIKSSRANKSNQASYQDIKHSTRGIIYFGTPHQGVKLDDLKLFLSNMSSLYTLSSNHPVLADLESDSNHLFQLSEEYKGISQSFETKVVYENLATQYAGGTSQVFVSKHLANIAGAANIEIVRFHKDHLNLVKFGSADDRNYQTIVEWLKDLVGK